LHQGILVLTKVSDWIELLNEPDGVFEKWIKRISESSPEIVQAQKSWYRRILSDFSRQYNAEAEVIIARAPARVNLVGMAIHEVTTERSEQG
jgi:hypothetical protein